MSTLLEAFDLGGTFVFALNCAMMVVKHRLDVFGVPVLSFATGLLGWDRTPCDEWDSSAGRFVDMHGADCHDGNTGTGVCLLSDLKSHSGSGTEWPMKTKAMNWSGRVWIPRSAKFSVAVNPMTLRYLNQMAERE